MKKIERERERRENSLRLNLQKLIVVVLLAHRHEEVSDELARMIEDEQPIALKSRSHPLVSVDRRTHSILSGFFRVQTDETIFARRTRHAGDVLEQDQFFRVRIFLGDVVNAFGGDAQQSNVLFVAASIDFDHFRCVLEDREKGEGRRREFSLTSTSSEVKKHLRLAVSNVS